MKKILITIIGIITASFAVAQNNVYGKKVVGLDSLVADTIRGRTRPYTYAEEFRSGNITVDNININGNQIESTSTFLNVEGETEVNISTQTSDGSDTGSSSMSGGGGIESVNRGAVVHVFGNENTDGEGELHLYQGNVVGARTVFFSGLEVEEAFMEDDGTWDFNTNSLTDIGSLTVDNLTLNDSIISTSATSISFNDESLMGIGSLTVDDLTLNDSIISTTANAIVMDDPVVMNSNLNVEGTINRTGGDLQLGGSVAASGGYYTESGTASVTTGGTVTIKTMTSSDIGAWLMFATYEDGTIGGASNLFFVRTNDFNGIQLVKNGSGAVDITLSGAAVQVFQSSGSTKNISWSLTKLSKY